jgi:hypothetical protein
MKTLIIIAALLTTGCSTLAPNTGTFGEGAVNVGLVLLATKAASNCVINCGYPMYQRQAPQVVVVPVVVQVTPAPVMQKTVEAYKAPGVTDEYRQYNGVFGQ